MLSFQQPHSSPPFVTFIAALSEFAGTQSILLSSGVSLQLAAALEKVPPGFSISTKGDLGVLVCPFIS